MLCCGLFLEVTLLQNSIFPNEFLASHGPFFLFVLGWTSFWNNSVEFFVNFFLFIDMQIWGWTIFSIMFILIISIPLFLQLVIQPYMYFWKYLYVVARAKRTSLTNKIIFQIQNKTVRNKIEYFVWISRTSPIQSDGNGRPPWCGTWWCDFCQ